MPEDVQYCLDGIHDQLDRARLQRIELNNTLRSIESWVEQLEEELARRGDVAAPAPGVPPAPTTEGP
jgi:hypothetical protein